MTFEQFTPRFDKYNTKQKIHIRISYELVLLEIQENKEWVDLFTDIDRALWKTLGV